MTEHNETIPTAGQRVADYLARIRMHSAGDQGAVAESLTTLGLPTKPSTVARIESGRQDPNLDQLLLLALFDGGRGLRDMLQVPFKIGNVIIETAFDLDCLLGYEGDSRTPDPSAEQLELLKTGRTAWYRATVTIDDTLINRQFRRIAEELDVDVADVVRATRERYGASSVWRVINDRTAERLAQDDPQPPLGSGTWQAYRSHAVRAVTREIAEHLGEPR
jgi:transcriptional regulator with XRE-family HTH domain